MPWEPEDQAGSAGSTTLRCRILGKPLMSPSLSHCTCKTRVSYLLPWVIMRIQTVGIGVPIMASMRTRVPSLASLGGLRIQHCHELWRRSQMQLGILVVVAVV